MDQADRHEQYMFRTHSRQELKEWAGLLRFFRFCRAAGGFANDPDTLQMAFGCRDEVDLAALGATLGIDLGQLPGYRTIALVEVWVEATPTRMTLSLSGADGDYYNVTNRDVANAARIEAAVAHLRDRIVEPACASYRGITPANYPELFESDCDEV